MGAFATTLLTLSLSMMNFRGLQNQTVFIGNLCFVAGIGMLISAQWEMLLGNTFSYTVLTAFCRYTCSVCRPFADNTSALLCRLRRHSYACAWYRERVWRADARIL